MKFDLSNEFYGKLRVIEKAHKTKSGQQLWRCLCQCGRIIFVQQGHLRDGHSKSCGKCNSYNIRSEVAECIVADGRHFIINASDLPMIKNYTWHICRKGYVSAHHKGSVIQLHRLLLRPPKNMFVDHIDRNPLNNCRENLRICSKHENCFNQGLRSDNTTGFKGVKYEKKCNKYIVRIGYKGKRYTIGRYPPDKLIEAVKAYNQKAVELFGEYAFLNEV